MIVVKLCMFDESKSKIVLTLNCLYANVLVWLLGKEANVWEDDLLLYGLELVLCEPSLVSTPRYMFT